jgi:hypothetical protein
MTDTRDTDECIHGVATVPESWMSLLRADNVHNADEIRDAWGTTDTEENE